MSNSPILGAPVSPWTPPPWPGPMRMDGRHVRLDPLLPAHAPALHEAMREHDGLWTYMPYGPFPSEAEYAAWVDYMASKSDPLIFAVTDRTVGKPSGIMSLMRMTPETGVIEVGHVCFAPSLQRTRAASKSVFLLADWVFRAGYRRFEWKCNSLNLPSRRAAQRFGFSFEGVFRQHMIVKGRNRDTAWFAMTDCDWRCLRPAWERWLDQKNFDAEGRQIEALGALTAPCLVARDPMV